MAFSLNITSTKFTPFENTEYFNILIWFFQFFFLSENLPFKRLNYSSDIFMYFTFIKILVSDNKKYL